MKVLLVGGGGREHALAWKLCRDDPSLELIAAPGNPGIARWAECVAIDPCDPRAGLAETMGQERLPREIVERFVVMHVI